MSLLFRFLLPLLLCCSLCSSLKIPNPPEEDAVYVEVNDELDDPHHFPIDSDQLSHPKAFQPSTDREEKGQSFWLNNGRKMIEERLKGTENRNVAKNIILFIGDGMSVPTLVAARILKGQRLKKSGEETSLGFEKFPYVGLSKTYCVDSQVADSACSATAYLNGVKANIATAGVTANVARGDCEAMSNPAHHTSSLAAWAQLRGKATGLVTTTRVTHASPSGVYAHTAHRNWEYDGAIRAANADPSKCSDIAKQLVYNSPGNNLKVIMGGGRFTFLPKNMSDPEYPQKKGRREDNMNLIASWLESKAKKNATAKFIWNRDDLLETSKALPEYLLGLFEPSHMKYHLLADEKTEPTLKEMVEVAINSLKRNSKGFFLFVEGGKIDLAHHDSYAQIALDETIEFDEAIMKAVEMTDEKDTLIVVTADHAHTMSVSGYPVRGSDIFTNLEPATDNLTYSTISYANGPGYKQNLTTPQTRYDLSKDKRDDVLYRFPATVPLEYETHGGDDVAVFSRGPWAHLLTGNYEQNYIPLVMGFAAKIGPTGDIAHPSSSSITHTSSFQLVSLFVIFSLAKHFWSD
uniref:Alkaline phosphatase n=1 Tax=Nilaparvata lugens TaxID=108931 RepID=A0A2L1IQA2_NILLU|nr:ALP-6 [Nilaparvata lugens]